MIPATRHSLRVIEGGHHPPPPEQRVVDEAVTRFSAAAIGERHHLHRHPELSNREYRTAERIAGFLRQHDVEVHEGIALTGVVGVLRGALPGPTLALRADMDALPVTEETSLPFRSRARTTWQGQEVGVSHACGHDVHMAVQLGTAATLSALRDRLAGTVIFVFQPAEEGSPPGEEGGARLMVQEGLLERFDPRAIIALHAHPELEVGKVGFTPGAAMAAVDEFRIELQGVQSHGARPEEGVDPIVMAADAVSALQSIRSRSLSPLEPSVVTVGVIRGGERFNIIPSSVRLEGTARTYSTAVSQQVETRMRAILEGVAATHGGGFDLSYERITPPVVNDAGLTGAAVATLEGILGSHRVKELPASMGGEDFAHFSSRIPGFYFRLGSCPPDRRSGGLHTPTFEADDRCIPVGMRAMTHLALHHASTHA